MLEESTIKTVLETLKGIQDSLKRIEEVLIVKPITITEEEVTPELRKRMEELSDYGRVVGQMNRLNRRINELDITTPANNPFLETQTHGMSQVDTTNVVAHNDKPLSPDYKSIDPLSGQQKEYMVLAPEERAKGFVRPLRTTYKHLRCGKTTTMGLNIAETYSISPGFYSGTFCSNCGGHYLVGQDGEFVWKDTNIKVGT